MRLVAEITFLGSTELRNVAATANLDNLANALKTNPGVGKEFLYFVTLPNGNPNMVYFDMFPDWAGHGNLVTADTSKNKAMLQAMLALEADPVASPKPSDALVW